MIYVLGSGGTGGELTVNAPAGVKVIATNSETGKSYTRTANADGVAVFKGLPEGTYDVTITDGERTSDPVPAKVVYKSETTVAFFQATIEIAYSEGATCTCSDGETTFTAPDTTGTWTCIVPNTGTWTVTVTDGEQTKTVDVEITADKQSESVTLEYLYYLYNQGDLCEKLTGGWEAKGETTTAYPTLGTFETQFGADNLRIYAACKTVIFGMTKNLIDLTNLNTITFYSPYVNVTTDSAGGKYQPLAVVTKGSSYAPGHSTFAVYRAFEAAGNYSLDVSALTGSYYIGFGAWNFASGTTVGRIGYVYLS